MVSAKVISTLIVDQLSVVITRRGFVVATHDGVSRGSGAAMMKKGVEEARKPIPWVPDPVTGYYKPEGQTTKVDAVELREMLLKKKSDRQ